MSVINDLLVCANAEPARPRLTFDNRDFHSQFCVNSVLPKYFLWSCPVIMNCLFNEEVDIVAPTM